ncbi:MAG: hypothetical protein JJ863_36580 [Deltaproteobacteria bacterium]|nr:hypothetical protein [Deltaproteobacteria bacterium]
MGYRDPSPPEPTTIPYGRFPTSKSEILFFVIIGLFGLGALVGATYRKTFRCERPARQVRCIEETSLLWQRFSRTFEGPQLSSVEFSPYTGDRGKEMGRTDIFDSVGQPTAVLRGSRAEAVAHFHRLRTFIDEPNQTHIEVLEQDGARIGFVVGLLCWLWCFFIGRSLWRTSGRIEVVVDAARDQIVVRARRFGLFRSQRVHPLAGLEGVAVEHTHIKRTKHGRGQQGDPGGKLRLDYRDGSPRELTSAALPGSEVHEDLAERLREATGLKPETRPVTIGGGASTSAATPPKKWSLYLVLLVPAVALLIGVGLEALMGSGGNRVHFRVEQRCKFQGAEMLPGAEMSMTLDPGEYVVEIFDPTVDGGWRTDTFEVREGRARDYVCR